MALTEAKLKDLLDKDFHVLFDDHVAVWTDLATAAYDHAQTRISSTPEPRPDDIALVLIPMLEVNNTLRDHQDQYRAKPKRWVEYFADYVIDRIYVNPQTG